MKVKEDELEIIIREQRSRQLFQPQWEKMIDLSSRRKEEEILLTAKIQKLFLERLTSKGRKKKKNKKSQPVNSAVFMLYSACLEKPGKNT